MSTKPQAPRAESDLVAAVRQAARQEQFLEVVSAEAARARFESHLDLAPLPDERWRSRPRSAACWRRMSRRRSTCRRSTAPMSTASRCVQPTPLGASETAPKQLALNPEVIACGHAPQIEVRPGTATTIATGGVVPRGADAVVMVEHTELIESIPAIELRRAAAAGQLISYAGSDIARGETLLRKATVIGSREIGMLAACGLATVAVVRRPKVAVLSTGDELVALGENLRPGGVYNSNGAILAAAVAEAGGEPSAIRRVPRRCRRAGAGGASRAVGMRHGAAVGRHLERRGRSVATAWSRSSASPASWCMAWR